MKETSCLTCPPRPGLDHLRHVGDVSRLAEQALAAPLSLDDSEGVRLLLAAGADPRRYADDEGEPASAAHEAVRAGCSDGLLGLLLGHGADPDRPGRDGRSPLALATVLGRTDLAEELRRHGAADDPTPVDRLLAALQHADSGAVRQLLAADPGLPGHLTAAQQAAGLIRAAETGNAQALSLMLDLGFAVDARGADHEATALHTAAYAGRAEVVRLLLDAGADVEARDGTWDSTPLGWAAEGSGGEPDENPSPDWTGTVRALLAAGASTAGITLSPDNTYPPEVADLLRRAPG
ncbi:MAG: ankyrin repeat domain-containing protein [Streptosporangiaceae bacterium]